MKNTIKKLAAALAVSAIAVSATSMSAFAAYTLPEGITQDMVDNSAVTPTVTVEKKTLKLEDAQANRQQTITMSISGADLKYNSVGFHISFDSNLKAIKLDKKGNVSETGKLFTKGEALAEFSLMEDQISDSVIFFSGMSVGNVGEDGNMVTMCFELPENVAAGDIYPINVEYTASSHTKDQFVGQPNNTESQVMEAWLFTKGIDNGFIAIEAEESSEPSSEPSSEEPSDTSEEPSETSEEPSETSEETEAPTDDSPETGVAGVGVAAAGLAVAIGTAFVLRKKED